MKKYLLLIALFSGLVFAASSSNRTLWITFIKNGTGTLTVPINTTDTLVGKATTDILTHKTMDGATNTWTAIPANTALTSQVPVANGGTALASGTASGLLYFSGTTAISSSGVLTAHGAVVSEGTSAPVTVTSSAAGQVYQGNGSSSDPTWTETPTLGVNATTTGILALATSVGSGQSISVKNGGATTAYNFILPTTPGSAGNVLTSQGGGSTAMTWTSPLVNPMSATGDIMYSSDNSGTVARLGIGANGKIATAASGIPSWAWENPYRSVTTTDAATLADKALILSGASFTETLPTAASNAGKTFILVHNGTTLTQIYTLATTSAQTIGGVASGSYALYTNGERLVLVSDGSNWQILNHETGTTWASYTPTLGAGFGTTNTVSYTWRRDGTDMLVRGTHINGTCGSAIQSWSLPGSMTISTMSITNTTSNPGPEVGKITSGTQGIGNIITATGTSTSLVYAGSNSAGAVLLTPSNCNVASSPTTTGSTVSVDFRVPITGWQP